MVQRIDPSVEQRIKVLSERDLTLRGIQKNLESEDQSVSYEGIRLVTKSTGKSCNARAIGLVTPPQSRRAPKATFHVIKKLDLMTSKENLIGQNSMSKQLGISQGHIPKLIRTKLGKTVRKKGSVHVLSESHKQPTLGSDTKVTWQEIYPNLLLHWTRHIFLFRIAMGPEKSITTRGKTDLPSG